MAKYHINPETGDPGVCRAKKQCPFGGEEMHFETKEDARENYEEFQELLYAPTQTKPKQSAATDAAFASSLKWEGKTPSWFKKIPGTKLQKKLFGATPELIDVIDSPIGPLAVVWEDNSVQENDLSINIERGYNTSRLTYRDMKTGETVAYLKAAYIDEDSSARSYGVDEYRGFRYLAEMQSFYGLEREYRKRKYQLGDTSYDEGRIFSMPALDTREKLEDFVSKANTTLRRGGRLGTLTDEELQKEYEEVKRISLELYDRNIENFRTPYIDYSNLKDSRLRGAGMGHALYIYAARKLAQKNLPLRASGSQSEFAKKSWLLMAADKRFPITVTNQLYKNRGYSQVKANYLLDFRNEQ